MAEGGRNGNRPKVTTPERYAETLPPEVAQGHSFSIQAIFELQRSFGKIERAVEGLEGKLEDHSKTLKTVERVIFVATGVFLVVSAIVGLAVKYGLDMLAVALAKH